MDKLAQAGKVAASSKKGSSAGFDRPTTLTPTRASAKAQIDITVDDDE